MSDRAGRFFLVHYLDCSDKGDEYWYLAPIDRSMIPRLLTGQISLLLALTSVPEEYRMIACLSSRDDNSCRFKDFIQCPDISSFSYYLPKTTFMFYKDEFHEYLTEELESVISYSRKRLAEVIYLRLIGPSILPNLFPLSQLSDIGKMFQRLITNFAWFRSDPNNFKTRGHGLSSIEHSCQFALTGVFNGSVQLRIESIQPYELFPEINPVFQGIQTFAELSELQDVQEMCSVLGQYPPRLSMNYLAYITAIQKSKAGVNLRWGSPRRENEWQMTWTAEKVMDVANEISRLTVSDESNFEATGYFIEGSMPTGKFKFLDTEAGRYITGKLSPDIEQAVITLSKESRVAVLYDVVIRELVRTTSANATSSEYTFIVVQEAGQNR